MARCRGCGDTLTGGRGGYRLCPPCTAARPDVASSRRFLGGVLLVHATTSMVVHIASKDGPFDGTGALPAMVTLALALGTLYSARLAAVGR